MSRPRGFNTYLEWDRGFRGWLATWFVTAVLALILHVVALVRIGRTGSVWWSASSANAWLFKTVVIVDVLWGVGVFIALVYGLGLFLHEDRATPRFWARYYVVVTILGAAIYVLHGYRMAVLRGDSLRMVLAESGWWRAASGVLLPLALALYWMRSKRVQNTYAMVSAAHDARTDALEDTDLKSIHKFSTRNRDLLARSEQAGCFYCQSLFDPAEIMDWVDGRHIETGDTTDGITALCPRCGIDAVLPSSAVTLRPMVLANMNAYWFSAR